MMLLCVDLQVYITNANKAVADMKSPEFVRAAEGTISAGPLARNGGGGYNHDLFC